MVGTLSYFEPRAIQSEAWGHMNFASNLWHRSQEVILVNFNNIFVLSTIRRNRIALVQVSHTVKQAFAL